MLRLVCELVREMQLAEAQGVLDAAGCTCPTGELAKGVFDERGAFYEVPGWVVADPAGVVADDDDDDEDEDEGEEDGEEDTKMDDADEALVVGRTFELGGEKGKGRVEELRAPPQPDKGRSVRVRARLSDRGTDVVVTFGPDEPAKVLVRRVRELAGVSLIFAFLLVELLLLI